MEYKAVLFDLDGTLLNTLEDIADSMNKVLTEHGFPTRHVQEYRHFVGNGSRMLVIRALPQDERSNEHLVSECLAGFMTDYGRNWATKTFVYAGVPQMLDWVTAAGLKKAILSNKNDEFTRRCVLRFLSSWEFDAVRGHRDGVPPKPDPRAALDIAASLGVKPSEFIYVGDSGVDMKTAVAAGMVPVGVLWGFREAGELLEAGARFLLVDPMDLRGVVGARLKREEPR